MKQSSSDSKFGRCALCLEEKTLRYSHIIPEFMYKPLYDAKHRLTLRSDDPDIDNEWVQKGFREYLLCSCCEERIGVSERYVSLLFAQLDKHLARKAVGFDIYQNVDLTKIKLFLNSILWRASISRHRFFSKITLGNTHNERLREIIKSQSPVKLGEYQCAITAIIRDGVAERGVIAEPVPGRIDGARVARFVFGGYAWIFLTASHSPKLFQFANSLIAPGEMRINRAPYNKIPFLDEGMRKIALAHQIRLKGVNK